MIEFLGFFPPCRRLSTGPKPLKWKEIQRVVRGTQLLFETALVKRKNVILRGFFCPLKHLCPSNSLRKSRKKPGHRPTFRQKHLIESDWQNLEGDQPPLSYSLLPRSMLICNPIRLMFSYSVLCYSCWIFMMTRHAEFPIGHSLVGYQPLHSRIIGLACKRLCSGKDFLYKSLSN